VKIDLRWQLLLAAVCLGFVALLLSNQERSSENCTITSVSTTGRLKEGIVGVPNLINPLFSDPNPVDRQLVDLIFDGLVRYDEDGYPAPALADTWSFSDDNRTITFTIDHRQFWHDGQPVTAKDVAFTYSLLQDENLPVDEGLRTFWQSVSIETIDESTISFTLPQPYSPFLEAVTRGILPDHILSGVPSTELANHNFNISPIGSGPFFVQPGNNWQEDGYLSIHPDPNHWREGTRLEAIEVRFYRDGAALKEAYMDGEIDAVTIIPASEIETIGSLPGIRLFSSPKTEFLQAIFNMTDSARPGMRVAAVRKALAYGINRSAISDEILKGQSILLEGPFPPSSWAYEPEILTMYTYQPPQSASLLDAEGWLIQSGAEVRIKDGEPLSLRLLSDNDPVHVRVTNQLAKQWSEIGVATEIESVTLDQLPIKLRERNFDIALIDITPLSDPDLYDFWSQEAIIRGQNYGGWNNRRASEALELGRKLPSVEERRPYYDAFLKYLDEDLPALTLLQYVDTYGIREDIQAVNIGLFKYPRDRYTNFNQWSFDSEEQSIVCPEPAGQT